MHESEHLGLLFVTADEAAQGHRQVLPNRDARGDLSGASRGAAPAVGSQKLIFVIRLKLPSRRQRLRRVAIAARDPAFQLLDAKTLSPERCARASCVNPAARL